MNHFEPVYQCGLCRKTKPESEFHRCNNPRKIRPVNSYCKTCNNQQSLERQQKHKQMAINYLGGACAKCGYNRCVAALDFHHRNPNEKDGRIAKLLTRQFERIKVELDKCTLLCKNCHAEHHHPC